MHAGGQASWPAPASGSGGLLWVRWSVNEAMTLKWAMEGSGSLEEG